MKWKQLDIFIAVVTEKLSLKHTYQKKLKNINKFSVQKPNKRKNNQKKVWGKK